MLHSFGRILVVINEVTFLWRKKTIFFFFFVMPLDGCTSDVDSGDINNLFPVLPFSDKSTDILVFNIFEKLWTFFNLVKHCRHMPSLVSNKCIYHPLSLIQQISSMKSIIYLLSLIFGPVTLKRICGDSLQQTHFGKVVWSSSIIRLKEKNISSLRQGARCWLASGTHIYSPSPYSPFMRKFMYPPFLYHNNLKIPCWLWETPETIVK